MKRLILILMFIILLTSASLFVLPKDPFLSAGVGTSLTQIDSIILEESGTKQSSPDIFFWLNSGAYFYSYNGIGSTILGELPSYSSWRMLYAYQNPVDTDNGYHPQNLFRLLTKEKTADVVQSLYVRVIRDNISESPNRNESNGIFLMQRYQDSGDLYYLGIRVDGTAVIKKKQNDMYTTLAQRQIFIGEPYDRDTNVNLIPKNSWIGLRTSVHTNQDDRSVVLELEMDMFNVGNWVPLLTAIDKQTPGNTPTYEAGYGGIRSDFMDIEFKNYSFEPIP